MISKEITPRGWRFLWREWQFELSQGGSLLSCEYAGRPLLYVSPLSMPDRRVRGGLPVCWPWFGTASKSGLPPHGFLQDCQLEPPIDGAVEKHFTVLQRGTFPLEAGMAEIVLRYRLDEDGSFEVSCSVRNVGEQEVSFDFALHPYLPLPASVQYLALQQQELILPVPDVIDEKWSLSHRNVTLLVNETPYLNLVLTGFEQIGLWRIGADQAHNIVDLPDEAWGAFICLEPLSLSQRLAKGEQKDWKLELYYPAITSRL